jgi:hypothetical protein
MVGIMTDSSRIPRFTIGSSALLARANQECGEGITYVFTIESAISIKGSFSLLVEAKEWCDENLSNYDWCSFSYTIGFRDQMPATLFRLVWT